MLLALPTFSCPVHLPAKDKLEHFHARNLFFHVKSDLSGMNCAGTAPVFSDASMDERLSRHDAFFFRCSLHVTQFEMSSFT